MSGTISNMNFFSVVHLHYVIHCVAGLSTITMSLYRNQKVLLLFLLFWFLIVKMGAS